MFIMNIMRKNYQKFKEMSIKPSLSVYSSAALLATKRLDTFLSKVNKAAHSSLETITRIPKQGYQWSPKNNICSPFF